MPYNFCHRCILVRIVINTLSVYKIVAPFRHASRDGGLLVTFSQVTRTPGYVYFFIFLVIQYILICDNSHYPIFINTVRTCDKFCLSSYLGYA